MYAAMMDFVIKISLTVLGPAVMEVFGEARRAAGMRSVGERGSALGV